MISEEAYFKLRHVSNSDLSSLERFFACEDELLGLEQAFRFGSLVDAMLTEPERCDHLNLKVDDVQFYSHEWNRARAMKASFLRDATASQFLKVAKGQRIFTEEAFKIRFHGIEFELPVRCKYDLWMNAANFGGDIKTTVATSQKQFEVACIALDYDRSRAFYMDISGAKKDFIIGISKKEPFKVFKVMIDRNHDWYKSGKEKYQSLSFKYFTLFEDLRSMKRIEHPGLIQL